MNKIVRKYYLSMVIFLVLPAYHVKAKCYWEAGPWAYGMHTVMKDHIDILFVVNNASDRWMYLWMGHPRHGEDNGNLNLKPHSSATALGCSNGAGYAVTGIILTQGKDVIYTFDVDKPHNDTGLVTMHTWKGGCYVALGVPYRRPNYALEWPVYFNMWKMQKKDSWTNDVARVRIDCV